MRLYAEKGHTITETERLELGRLLLKLGLTVCMGREKAGSAIRHYIEFYRPVELGKKEAAPEVTTFESGGISRKG